MRFTDPVECHPRAAKPLEVAPQFVGKLYILTDNACFSACLSVTQMWRRLGAVQIGQVTSSDKHYNDVNDRNLPSGLGTFSTQVGFAVGTPLREGPYTPEYEYVGEMSDDAAVERWAVALATAQIPAAP